MTGSLITDDSLRAARLALDGLSLRQQVIGRNIANVDTPGYQAQSVDFESVLKNAVKGNDTLKLEKSNTAHLASPTKSAGYEVSLRPGGSNRADMNNVDIDVELLEMSETGIQYQALTQSISKKLELLKLIATSR